MNACAHTYQDAYVRMVVHTFTYASHKVSQVSPAAVMEANRSAHALLAVGSESVVNAYGSAEALLTRRPDTFSPPAVRRGCCKRTATEK